MVVELRSMEDVGQKKSLSLYLADKDEQVFVPIYFGVVCAVASLNLLGARKKMMDLPMNGRGSSKAAIENMLRGATQLLGLLIWKMAEKNDEKEWKSEKIEILAKVAKAEAEVGEMKKRRAEDAKANEKVVAMFATQEHNWKNERKTLRQQLEAVVKDLQLLQARTQMQISIVDVDDKQNCCSECLVKEQRISDLNEKLGEKEFLVMATVQAAEVERNQLQQRLNSAEAIAQELEEKVSKESEERQAEFRRHKAAFIDFVSNQRQMKAEMGLALRQLESENRERQIILKEQRDAKVLIHRLSLEIAHLEKDVQEREQVISAMLEKSNADAKENQELEKELKISNALRKQAEFEVERWRRICEGKKDTTAKHRWRLRSRLATGDDVRSDLYTEMKRLQAEEIRSLHIKYGRQVEYLQHKISRYEEKLTELEASILLHLGQSEKSPCSQKLQLGCSRSGSKDLVEVRDCLEAEIDPLKSQSPVSKDHLVQHTDTETSKEFFQRKNKDNVTPRVQNGFKDWIKLDKARHAARLGKKHWQKLDAFSRQNRINDDRMEALNWHMINMERGTEKLQSEIEILNSNLKQAREEKLALETLLVEKNHDLELLKEMLDLHQNKLCNKKNSHNFHLRPPELDAEAMQLELKALKRKFRERERDHRAILIKVLEEVENELQDKDYKLAVTEAKMIQVQIQYEQERKSKEKIISETIKKINGSQNCSVDPVVEQHESCTKSTTADACVEVEKLSEMIARARDHMMERENHHEKQLNDLIEQAAKVSKAGCQLRTVKNLLHTAEEKIENSVECSMSQTFQEEIYISVADPCILNKEHDVGNRVLMLRNDTRNNSLSTKNRFLIRRSNAYSKGKTIISGQCSTLMKMEQPRDEGHSERKNQRQASEKNLPLTHSVSDTKLHRNSNAPVDELASLNVLNGDSSWQKDAQALAVFSKVKELEQQLEQLEKISKLEMSNLPNIKDARVMIQTENDNEDWQAQLKLAPISAIHLLKKQLKRYQSLIEKIDDLCKRMQNKDALGTVNCSLDPRTREQSAAKELFLIETFQLQRYVVATGQKLMAIQQEISHNMSSTSNELGFPAIVNILESIEIAKCNLKEIQRNLEVRIARIIGDLEGTLACEGILHVTPMEWSKRHKLKAGKSVTPFQGSEARLQENAPVRV
ncbi:uncharacterized protein LOC131065768 isoform X2 [Cryptomeria japonica]|uniref:uncharacterized protein LOC131065768 isoform X2 n=1 Tax=Cryptomeria japonica TaxID=3369 RepID=UPI0027DA4C68|nr:uncharacterized protein LOC131065768 isoform X2 [Cryptomeria japonica]